MNKMKKCDRCESDTLLKLYIIDYEMKNLLDYVVLKECHRDKDKIFDKDKDAILKKCDGYSDAIEHYKAVKESLIKEYKVDFKI